MKVIRYYGLDDENWVHICHFNLKWCFINYILLREKFAYAFGILNLNCTYCMNNIKKEQKQSSFPLNVNKCKITQLSLKTKQHKKTGSMHIHKYWIVGW